MVIVYSYHLSNAMMGIKIMMMDVTSFVRLSLTVTALLVNPFSLCVTALIIVVMEF